MQCPGLSLGIQYLFPVSIYILLLMLLCILPVLTGTLVTLVSDTCYNSVYMDPAFGGDPVLYQHYFWFFGHPEVYILIIPSFGILNHITGIVSGGVLVYGDQSMVLAISCISILGSLVWGHHIYTLGMETDTRSYYTGITVMISLPTGTKLMNWVYTLVGDIIRNSLTPGYHRTSLLPRTPTTVVPLPRRVLLLNYSLYYKYPPLGKVTTVSTVIGSGYLPTGKGDRNLG